MHCMKKFRLSTRGIPLIFVLPATQVALLLINNIDDEDSNHGKPSGNQGGVRLYRCPDINGGHNDHCTLGNYHEHNEHFQ